MTVLSLGGVSMKFGGLAAVTDLDLAVGGRELLGLIGPNGAGKTTVFNMITGVYAPAAGSIVLDGDSIAGRMPHEIARRGIARTFQNIRLFGSLTVFENVLVPFHRSERFGLTQSIIRTPAYLRRERERAGEALDVLGIFGLLDVRNERSTALPYGIQRRVEIARALAMRPKLLLLDEPAAGMNPTEKGDLMRLIKEVKEKFSLAILLIEHDMNVVMGICERIVVLDYGVKIADGSPAAIRNDPKVIEAYLGEPPA